MLSGIGFQQWRSVSGGMASGHMSPRLAAASSAPALSPSRGDLGRKQSLKQQLIGWGGAQSPPAATGAR
jgi:hypothetical protein